MRHQQQSRVETIVGCMFAGKTAELLRRINRAEIAGKNVQAFTQSEDTRYNESCIATHTEDRYEAEIVDSAEDILDNYNNNIEVVAIDEANFFSDNLVDVVETLADRDVRVVISGLDQNFRGEPFHPVPELMAISDEVDKLTAICSSCGGTATKTQRLDSDGEPAREEEQEILVSGGRFYEARCRNCHQLR